MDFIKIVLDDFLVGAKGGGKICFSLKKSSKSVQGHLFQGQNTETQ